MHSNADNVASLSNQKTHAVSFEPTDVSMNEVYMSDDDDSDDVGERSMNSSIVAASVPDSALHHKPQEAMALSPSKSAPSRPVSAVSTAPPPAVPGSTSCNPPGFIPQQQSGTAFSSAVSLPAGDLAQVESVLKENPLLTEQVMALIVQQYPLYAANPLSLRFAVCHELQLLKKLRVEQGQPAAQAAPSTSSGYVSSASVGGANSLTTLQTQGSEQWPVQKLPSSNAAATTSSSSPLVTDRNAENGLTRSSWATLTTVTYSSTSACTSNTSGATLRDGSGRSTYHTVTTSKTNCSQQLPNKGTALMSKTSSASLPAGRNGDGGTKRSAWAALTSDADSFTPAWTTATSGAPPRGGRSSHHSVVSVNHTSARPNVKSADALDSFSQESIAQRGICDSQLSPVSTTRVDG